MSEESVAIGEKMFTAVIPLGSVIHVPLQIPCFPWFKILGLQLCREKSVYRKIPRGHFINQFCVWMMRFQVISCSNYVRFLRAIYMLSCWETQGLSYDLDQFLCSFLCLESWTKWVVISDHTADSAKWECAFVTANYFPPDGQVVSFSLFQSDE